MLNTFPREGDDQTRNIPDLYPEHLAHDIDTINEEVYNGTNNGKSA